MLNSAMKIKVHFTYKIMEKIDKFKMLKTSRYYIRVLKMKIQIKLLLKIKLKCYLYKYPKMEQRNNPLSKRFNKLLNMKHRLVKN